MESALVGTEIDGQSRSCEVMVISRPDGLGHIAALGLTLAESKQLLVQVQQGVVAAQARQHTAVSAGLQACTEKCRVKGRRPHRIATLFGEVKVKLPGWHVRAAVVARPVAAGHRTAGQPLSWIDCKPGFQH